MGIIKKAGLTALIVLLSLLVLPSVYAAKTCIYEFQSLGCPHCAKVEAFLNDLESEYNLDVRYIDANKESKLFADLLGKYEVPMDEWGLVPTVFIGDYYCIGDSPCISNLEQKIIENEGAVCPDNKDGYNHNASVQPRRETIEFTFAGITGLALVDAVNPCALAVLVILLSTILLRDPEKKSKALHAGIAFTFAVYFCYFIMGALIVFGLKWVTSATSLSTLWLYKAFGVFAIIIGILNIKDYFKYGAGGFVMEVPMKWRPKMKEFISSVTSTRGAFLVGIIVSLFLLPCTSGPYFVAGGLLAGVQWMTALPWLAYYNLLFVAPMIIITLVVYGGLTAVGEISGWRERNIRRLHLFAGIILVALGIAMVAGLV
ncbi:GAP family protein [Candidatus Woesearchaeota archaeon]|nr:GAP family protein [Candidatus Woesearchaeota archaeon]